jgi:single-strand DNA-binding protein
MRFDIVANMRSWILRLERIYVTLIFSGRVPCTIPYAYTLLRAYKQAGEHTMFQQITLVGNLGRDPEMRYTPSGVPVTSFSVATSKRYQSQDGQWQDKTVWFRATAWRKTAEVASQYLTKGSKVLIVGELEEPRTWVDKDGNTQVSLEVTVQTIKFLSGRGEGANGGDFTREPARAQSGGKGGNNSDMMDDGPTDEDIPF